MMTKIWMIMVLKTAGELVRITYTSGSQYHQDPAIEEPMFPGLSMAMGLTRENTSEDYYLAVQTRICPSEKSSDRTNETNYGKL